MAAPTELNLESVRVFILQRGGQVTNQEIAKHFRQFLKDPSKPEQKELFKDIVKVIAVVKKCNDEKIIKLRNDYSYAPLEPPSPVSSLGSQGTFDSSEYLDKRVYYDPQPIGLPEMPTRIIQSQSSPDILLSNLKQDESEKLTMEATTAADYSADSYSPTAPPRKKSYKENKKPRAPQPPEQTDDDNNKSNEDDDEQTPRISVKEQASKLNKIASESQINLKPTQNVTQKRKDAVKTDDETTSVTSATDPQSRDFFLKCAQGDYHALTRLLRDDPQLVKHKDVIYGYTALHWAAKRGHSDMVKLIAGTFALSANIRSNAGYTPLHLAAMHNHRAVYDLLIQTYGADASLRDYGGKRAQQLFKDWKKGNNEQQRPEPTFVSYIDLDSDYTSISCSSSYESLNSRDPSPYGYREASPAAPNDELRLPSFTSYVRIFFEDW